MQSPQATQAALPSVKALVFDVFGTVVDWRSSVAREVEALAKRKKLTVDGAAFADAWRAGYGPSMNRVRTGELPWTPLDRLHRMTLDGLLGKFGGSVQLAAHAGMHVTVAEHPFALHVGVGAEDVDRGDFRLKEFLKTEAGHVVVGRLDRLGGVEAQQPACQHGDGRPCFEPVESHLEKFPARRGQTR